MIPKVSCLQALQEPQELPVLPQLQASELPPVQVLPESAVQPVQVLLLSVLPQVQAPLPASELPVQEFPVSEQMVPLPVQGLLLLLVQKKCCSPSAVPHCRSYRRLPLP